MNSMFTPDEGTMPAAPATDEVTTEEVTTDEVSAPSEEVSAPAEADEAAAV